MNNYRVGNPSELVDILNEKQICEVMISILGCFNEYIGDSKGRALSIEKHEKELVIANSDDEELRLPIDYIMSANAVTSENEDLEITMDPTYIIKMLKAEVLEDLEQYEGYKKTQEVWHKLRKMREEMGE